MAEVPAGAIFIQDNGVTVVQHKPEDWQNLYESVHGHGTDNQPAARLKTPSITVNSHAYKVNFLKAAAKPQIIAEKPI